MAEFHQITSFFFFNRSVLIPVSCYIRFCLSYFCKKPEILSLFLSIIVHKFRLPYPPLFNESVFSYLHIASLRSIIAMWLGHSCVVRMPHFYPRFILSSLFVMSVLLSFLSKFKRTYLPSACQIIPYYN